MKNTSALLLVSLLSVACASSPASMNSSSTSAGSGTGMKRATPTHYRLLSDPRNIREINWSRPPANLHVKGQMTTLGFVPLSQVEGTGRLCADGKDWVSLKDGVFHQATDGATPDGPYVVGCKNKMGGFTPASKEISNS